MRRCRCFDTLSMRRSWEWGRTSSKLNSAGQVKTSYFLFLVTTIAVYWANLKGAFTTYAACNAPNPHIPCTDKGKKKKKPQKHCVSSPCVENFCQPSGAICHFTKRCNKRAGCSLSVQSVLQHHMLLTFFPFIFQLIFVIHFEVFSYNHKWGMQTINY